MPPHPFDAQWYIAHVDGKTNGPYSGHEIRRMVEQRQIVGSNFVWPDGGSKWVKAENEPTLGVLFQRPEHAEPRHVTGTSGRRKAVVIVASIALLTLGWLAWPYYALFDLTRALREGDTVDLENRIAWDSVRQGLRGDLNAMFLQKLSADASVSNNDIGTELATILGPTIINQLVDGYVTPQAVANLIRTGKPASIGTATVAVEDKGEQSPQFDLRRVKYASFSGGPLTFKVEVIPKSDAPVHTFLTLIFKWSGDWKLTRIILPADVMPTVLAKVKSPTLSKEQSPLKGQGPSASHCAAVAQRVVLNEDDPSDPQGKQYVGSAIWRTEMVSPGPGLAPELAVRADVEIPERRITMAWSIRRNTDKNLPASHTIEIMFNLSTDFPHGGISNVPGIMMKQAEATRGTPLAGLGVKVATDYFLIGLVRGQIRSGAQHSNAQGARLVRRAGALQQQAPRYHRDREGHFRRVHLWRRVCGMAAMKGKPETPQCRSATATALVRSDGLTI